MRIIAIIVLWGAVIFGTPLVLLAFGASKDVAMWVGSGLMFGAITHLSQSPYWKRLSNRELNPLSSRYGQSVEPRPERPPVESTLGYRLGKWVARLLQGSDRKK